MFVVTHPSDEDLSPGTPGRSIDGHRFISRGWSSPVKVLRGYFAESRLIF
jgi:hypothetical protein